MMVSAAGGMKEAFGGVRSSEENGNGLPRAPFELRRESCGG